MPKVKPTALGVHIFAGGFTVGVSKHFNIIGHCEQGDYGVSSAKLNWPKIPIYVGEENWPLDSLSNTNVDFVYCNPPCAIFSTAGIVTTRGQGSWRSDPRLRCWYSAFEVMEAIRPKVWALESVPQALTSGRPVVDELTKKALGFGYSVQHVLIDAKWTGVPQSRKRFFFICHKPRFDLKLWFDRLNGELATVGGVLSLVKDPGHINYHNQGANFAQYIKHTKPGEKLRMAFARLKPNAKRNARGHVIGRPGFNWARLPIDGQMGAFIGDTFAHPTKNRFLGVNEMKALCGYPQDFKLAGKPSQHASLLARAVLPTVGGWLAYHASEALKHPVTKQLQRVITLDLRKGKGEPIDVTENYM